ncbi:hypothetical protein BCV70DRAFT_105641 [Testicularia cyperi]|uniref:Uncharacterized protein n=1 Tax=Testicularia cyperi TaxID=1882483 RepID=A0A317XS20_9BASI|nr:hypothetical protein BCV70DRAFT_105641 [Testicularia cyperi]
MSNFVVVILLNRAAKVHRLAILSHITASARFQIDAERSFRIILPQDDVFLRRLIQHEIESDGEAEALVRWAPTFTLGNNFAVLLSTHGEAATEWQRTWSSLPRSFERDDFFVVLDPAVVRAHTGVLFEVDSILDSDYLHNVAGRVADRVAGEVDALVLTPSDAQMQATDSEPDFQLGSGSGFSQTSARSESTTATSVTADAVPYAASKTCFRARPAPASTAKPTIQPRLSKAAALRMGVEYAPASPRPASVTPVNGNVGISGVPRSDPKLPASLRAPTIAPRLNKAAVARTKPSTVLPSPSPQPASRSQADPSRSTSSAGRLRKEVDFSNTPGHKRTGSIAVASTAAPLIPPRQNRASMSRLQSHSATVGGLGGAAVASSMSPLSVTSAIPSRPRRASSAAAFSSASSITSMSDSARQRVPVNFDNVPGHKRQSLSLKISSLAAPTVVPRQNRASLARTTGFAYIDGCEATRRFPSKPRPTSTLGFPSSSAAHGKENVDLKLGSSPLIVKRNPPPLASLAPPSIAPRLNRATEVRLAHASNVPHPPSSFRS